MDGTVVGTSCRNTSCANTHSSKRNKVHTNTVSISYWLWLWRWSQKHQFLIADNVVFVWWFSNFAVDLKSIQLTLKLEELDRKGVEKLIGQNGEGKCHIVERCLISSSISGLIVNSWVGRRTKTSMRKTSPWINSPFQLDRSGCFRARRLMLNDFGKKKKRKRKKQNESRFCGFDNG